MVYEVLESRAFDPNAGFISDQTILLTAKTTYNKYPDALILVVYKDFET